MTDATSQDAVTTKQSGMFCKGCAETFPTGAGLRIKRKPQLKCPSCGHVSPLTATLHVPIMQGSSVTMKEEMVKDEQDRVFGEGAPSGPQPAQASWRVAIDPGEAAALIIFEKGKSARIQNLMGDIDAAMEGIDRLRGIHDAD